MIYNTFTHIFVLGTLIILGSVLFHAGCLVLLARWMQARFHKSESTVAMLRMFGMILVSTLVVVALHSAEAWLWAWVYLQTGEIHNLQDALYFSVVTATTLGYGDVTLSQEWRLLASFEAMGGLILFSLSTAFLLGLMRKLF